jgi:hypothetical protein
MIHVNKCKKISINIMKDVDRKFIPFHKMCKASDGLKYLYKMSSKELHPAPSHFSYVSTLISFGIFLRAPSQNLILGIIDL